ncbi:transketolase family protein [Thalassospira xiamenensis]|uniref:Transketolase n=1 Tax=Thalassospira xiamenensis TaxID=220697 RepID=A0ABR5Y632_9PROT|nr:transketolase C-terminal domain-containing protein [Thalassospira xiamenensis]KZD05692.1 transketolase [Thalassospira xiamenensis]KZD09625.1 transketolase [Thalassospira xiamenensis]MCD1595246.1 hypothetical protein [Thalassospira xiamenensis]
MRTAFADEITKLGVEDPRVVLLSGDIGNRMFDDFKAQSGSRFLNCGIAEANMMSMAAGMALSGLRPVIYTITPFTTTRCLEQIRVGVCYHKAPVIIVGTGSGLSYSSLGPTHHSLEDVAILRTLPGMIVFSPADKAELRAGLREALKQDKPVYIRLGKKNEPQVHSDELDHSLTLGKSTTIREGSDVCLIGSGNILPEVVSAADALAESGVSAHVESFHTVKPLDTERLSHLFERFSLVAVSEEHSIIGGLNSAVAQWMVEQPAKPGTKLVSIATRDEFLHEIGNHDFARRHFGIDAKSIKERVIEALKAQKESLPK